jgi:molecular chaperone DnaK
LGEEMQKAQQAQGAAPGGGSDGETKADVGKKDDGNVVDAEFEEVKDGKK